MPPTQRCGECREPIYWVALHTGKRMPVNTEPDAEGTVAINRDVTGRWVGRVLKADEQPDAWERRHVTHFATCKVLLARRQREAAAKAAGATPAQVPGAPTTPQVGVISMAAYRARLPRAPRHGKL